MSSKLVHDIEVFGPAATVMGYRNYDELLNLVKRGEGSLVSSIFSADLKEIELSIKATTNAIFKDPFYVIGYFITLFLISFKLTLFILLFLPLAGLIISKISNYSK